MDSGAAFDAGKRLASTWALEAARERRTAAAVRRLACARLRRAMSQDLGCLLPEVTGMPRRALGRAVEAGFLAGLHASLWRMSGGRLGIGAGLAREVGYTVGYLGVICAPDDRYASRGDLASRTLEAISLFVACGARNPLISGLARRGLWAPFWAGVAGGLQHAAEDVATVRRLHLGLVRRTPLRDTVAR
jgi:hypothetical protein